VYLVEGIEKYENGKMNLGEVIELFQGLVNTGVAWTLQKHYAKTARVLIHQGLITPNPSSADYQRSYNLEP